MHARIPSVLALIASLPFVAPTLSADEFPANHMLVFTSDGASVPFTGSVRMLDADGNERAAVYGLANPECGVIGPTGQLFVLSRGDDTVRIISPSGQFGLIENVFPAGPAPAALALGPHGNLYVASQGNDVIYQFDTTGLLLNTLGANSGLVDPAALAFGPGGHLFAASAATGLVHEFDAGGLHLGTLGQGTGISSASGLAFGPDGRLYVSSPTQGQVFVFEADGTPIAPLGGGSGLASPAGLGMGPDGHLHVVSRGDDLIYVFDRDGELVRTVDPGLDELNGGLGFVPYRFPVAFETRLYADGVKLKKNDLVGVLSLSPGSQRMMLHFTDLAGLAGVTDHDQLVLHGFEARPGDPADEKKRLYQGRLIESDVVGDGTGSLSLLVTGKFGSHDWYQVKKAEGDFVRGAATAGAYGEVRTGNLLE